jgi:hypothetical protein
MYSSADCVVGIAVTCSVLPLHVVSCTLSLVICVMLYSAVLLMEAVYTMTFSIAAHSSAIDLLVALC